MASSMSSAMPLGAQAAISRREADTLIRQIQSTQFLNKQLISICRTNGLQTSGVKAELQRRIVDHIQSAINANDSHRFQAIKISVDRAKESRNGVQPQTQFSNGHQFAVPPPHAQAYPTTSINSALKGSAPPFTPQNYASSASNGHRPLSATANDAMHLSFTSSPFYQVIAPIAPPRHLEAIASNRMTRSLYIRVADLPALQNWQHDKSYHVLAFCTDSRQGGPQKIAFPHQAEIKVNGDEVKHNYRGLKNKPGSTLPADITDKLHLRSTNYNNKVEFTWALTQKPFWLQFFVCKVTEVMQLVERLRKGRKFPKESVIADFNRKAADPDIEATSFVLSLKCPLTYMRLDVPCRGSACKHVQCFDATSYLQLQEQAPTWLCPICNNEAKYESLAVDEYVKDILDKTSKSLESVTIEPNGQWSVPGQQAIEPRSSNTNGHSIISEDLFDDDDDDLVIVSPGGGRMNGSTPAFRPSMSRADSTPGSAPRGAASTSNKRPAPEVIDLLSDSDDEPPRPVKRQATETNGYVGVGSPF